MLSIIIVNYFSEKLLADCLETLYRQSDTGFFEVLVVNNGGGENAKQNVLQQFPLVQWIEMGYNAGFARANNEGIRQSNGDAVLLLNPDVLIENDAVLHSYERLMESGYIGCGLQLLNPDRSPQISGSFFMKGGLNHLLPLPVLGKLFKWLGESLKVKKPSVFEASGVPEVDWVNGAYLMVKKTATENAGLLDEDFFLYAEEIEWCARLRKTGAFCIYGDLHAVHLQGEVANESFGSAGKGYYNLFDKKGKQLMLSNFVRIRKQFGTGWFLIHLFFYTAEVPFSFLLALFSKDYNMRLWKGYCRNLCFLLSKTGRIINNNPYFYKAF
ncbi:MAG: glycosyltransferase [Flavisolibacter sp.]